MTPDRWRQVPWPGVDPRRFFHGRHFFLYAPRRRLYTRSGINSGGTVLHVRHDKQKPVDFPTASDACLRTVRPRR